MTKEKLSELEADRLAQGLSIASYAKSINYSKTQYYYWRRRYRHLDNIESTGNFLPLDIFGKCEAGTISSNSVSNIEIEMRTSAGAELRLKGMFTAQMLSSIIKSSSNLSDV